MLQSGENASLSDNLARDNNALHTEPRGARFSLFSLLAVAR